MALTMFEKRQSVHLSYRLSTVALALIVLLSIVLHAVSPATDTGLTRLPVWARYWYAIQNSVVFGCVAMLFGAVGMVASARLRGTERGSKRRELSGLYGTTSEFVYMYSLAALAGGLVSLISRVHP